jgi:hypothetical protein
MSKNTFDHHVPTSGQLARIQIVREEFKNLEAAILANSPAGRHRAVAMTHLETAAMWAIKAIIFEGE